MTDKPLTVSNPQFLRGNSDRVFREFLHAFMIFSRQLEAVRCFLASQVGVTAPQYEILSHLRECLPETGLTVNEIAERLRCTGSFATTEIGKLTHAGLSNKKRDINDARRVNVTVTATCERRFRKIAPLQRKLNDALFFSLNAAECQALYQAFPKLTKDGDRAHLLTKKLSARNSLTRAAGSA